MDLVAATYDVRRIFGILVPHCPHFTQYIRTGRPQNQGFSKPPPPQRVRHMYEARLDKIYELHVSLYMYMMYVTLQPLGVDQTFMPYMKAMYEGTVA